MAANLPEKVSPVDMLDKIYYDCKKEGKKYLYVYNPGIICYDSFDQLNQIATNNFRNWHPFFHTFIEMLCLKIYANPITICVLQILTFSFNSF